MEVKSAGSATTPASPPSPSMGTWSFRPKPTYGGNVRHEMVLVVVVVLPVAVQAGMLRSHAMSLHNVEVVWGYWKTEQSTSQNEAVVLVRKL
jgi:hypothetical protein